MSIGVANTILPQYLKHQCMCVRLKSMFKSVKISADASTSTCVWGIERHTSYLARDDTFIKFEVVQHLIYNQIPQEKKCKYERS